MQMRRIGDSELVVSAVGFGCMGLSHASGAPTEKKEAVKIIQQAYSMGYTMFDTAECYTGVNADGTISYNEELVGAGLKSIRDKVVIATKCGVKHAGDHLIFDSRPEVIRKSAEDSLKRLGSDYIDLYYQHRIDPNVAPEEVAGVMSELIQEGKIRYWGISETTEEYLRRANAVCKVTAIENRYSMMARWHESIFPTVEELGIGYIAFSSMANGFLSGQYNQNTQFDKSNDFRGKMPQFSEEGVKRSQELMELLAQLAKEKNATQAQISLAWMLCKKSWIIPIPGSRKPSRMKENIAAADVILTREEIKKIDDALTKTEFLVFGGHGAKK